MSQQYPPAPGQPPYDGSGRGAWDAQGHPGQPDAGAQPPATYQAPPGQAPYGQAPFGQDPYGQNVYGQAPSSQAPYGQNPYEQNPYGQSPYAVHDPYGRPEPTGLAGPTGDGVHYGQQPPSPYGPVAPYGAPRTPPGRPVWKIVLGTIFAAIAGIMALAALAATANGNGPSRGDAAYLFGYVVGQLLMVLVPAFIAWLLLRRR